MERHQPEPRDVDHYDTLATVRDRFFALRCAVKGADISSHADRNGLLQLAEDIAEALKEVCTSFAREWAIQIAEAPPKA